MNPGASTATAPGGVHAHPSIEVTRGRRPVYITASKLAVDISRIFEMTISVRTLAKWRSAGRGPAFLKIGGRVRYAVRDVERWVDAQRRNGAAAAAANE